MRANRKPMQLHVDPVVGTTVCQRCQRPAALCVALIDHDGARFLCEFHAGLEWMTWPECNLVCAWPTLAGAIAEQTGARVVAENT